MTETKAETEAEESAIGALDVLEPDQHVTVGGEAVTVREFRWGEGMRLMGQIRPILDAFRQLIEGERDPEDLSVYDELLEQYPDLLLDLTAAACDRPREWVEQLSDEDGYALQTAFWRANSRFFMRRLVLSSPRMRAAVAEKVGADALASSSSPS